MNDYNLQDLSLKHDRSSGMWTNNADSNQFVDHIKKEQERKYQKPIPYESK